MGTAGVGSRPISRMSELCSRSTPATQAVYAVGCLQTRPLQQSGNTEQLLLSLWQQQKKTPEFKSGLFLSLLLLGGLEVICSRKGTLFGANKLLAAFPLFLLLSLVKMSETKGHES